MKTFKTSFQYFVEDPYFIHVVAMFALSWSNRKIIIQSAWQTSMQQATYTRLKLKL